MVFRQSVMSLRQLQLTMIIFILFSAVLALAEPGNVRLRARMRMHTVEDRGVWHTELLGHIFENKTLPVSLQLFIKGLCQGESMIIRGQMYAVPLEPVYSSSDAHILQPQEVIHWKPQFYFRSAEAEYLAVAQNVSEFLQTTWNWRRGVLAPVPFNATLPLSLRDEVLTIGIRGWDFTQWLHPATDFQLQCKVPLETEERRLFHVLPPILGPPSTRSFNLLDQQVAWHKAVGVTQSLLYVTKDNVQHYQSNSAMQKWISSGQAILVLWDRLPNCIDRPYCLKTFMWSHSLLLLWEMTESWIFMSDVDEFLALPEPQSISTLLYGCLQFDKYGLVVLPRYNAVCPTCDDDVDKPWVSEFPLSFHTARAKKAFPRWLGKAIVSTHRVHSFDIHLGLVDGKTYHVNQKCAFVVHLCNAHRLRAAYNETKFNTVTSWLWPQGQAELQSV